jgi:hypothetical protein
LSDNFKSPPESVSGKIHECVILCCVGALVLICRVLSTSIFQNKRRLADNLSWRG